MNPVPVDFRADAIRIDLGLPVRKVRSPIGVPVEVPTLDVLSVSGHTIRLRLHGQTDRGKPAGVAGARLFYCVGETAPAELSDWRPLADVTRSLSNVTMPDAQPGQCVWLLGCWFNPRLQNGPLSQAICTHVQWSIRDSARRASVIDRAAAADLKPNAGVRKAA